MKRINKIALIIVFGLAFPIIIFISVFFITNSRSEIYKLIPQDADIVIEINAKNIIKEIVYQRIYNFEYFDEKIPEQSQDNTIDNIEFNSGVDVFSNAILFRESWAEKEIWFGIIKVINNDDFTTYCESIQLKNKPYFTNDYAIIQLSTSENQKDVDTHLKNIVEHKVKSFDAKIDLSEKFKTENEINIYIAPKKSKYIIEGFLFLNFLDDKVTISGNFTPIGKIDNLSFINYKSNNNSALSLRSSLNLFNSVYLFNNRKIHNIPDYDQLALDIDGSTLLMCNSEIPFVALPHINLHINSDDSLTWHNYVHSFDHTQGIIIDTASHQIIIDSEGKARINYNSTANVFSVFQDSSKLISNPSTDTYFDLKIIPQLFIDHTVFKEDSLNPPKMTDKLKISIFQGMMQNITYLKDVSFVNFKIKKDESNTDLLSEGTIQYANKDGHSIIESISILMQLINTLDIVSE